MIKVKDLMDCEPVLMKGSVSIGECYQSIVKGRNVVIVDANAYLEGIITTDVIYRAIAEGIPFTEPATRIMERVLTVVNPDDSIEVCKNDQEIWPVLDNNQVIAIVKKQDVNKFWDNKKYELLKYFTTLLESVPLGIIFFDSAGCVEVFNHEAERFLGLSMHDVIGKSISEIPMNNDLLKKVVSDNMAKRQSYFHQGRTLVINRIPIIEEDKTIGLLLVLQDISKQTALACSLNSVKVQNRELDSIIEAFSEGIYISDGQGVGLRVNKAYEQITGLKAKDLINKNLAEVVAQGFISKASTLKTLEEKKTVTYTQKYMDEKELLVTSNPIFNEEGEITRVVTTVRDVTELNQLQKRLSESSERSQKYYQELILLREQQLKTGDVIAVSPAMQAVVDLANRAAKVDSTCLILGESGVGKDVIARLIHANSVRSKQPYLKINCGAIPRELLEAELFGYDAGAFTGARKEGKPGMFELAHEGTLFLDEIGEMPPELQVKLLEVLQDMTIQRVGGTKPIRIDVRIIAATNRNIEEMVEKGLFRKDLYYRLNIIPIEIPPLRERPEDIVPLIEQTLQQLNEKFAKNVTFSPEVIKCLLNYDWPGNVRELRNIIERMLVISREDIIEMENIPANLSTQCEYLVKNISSNKLKVVLEEVEKKLLIKTLNQHKSIRKAAKILGINHATACRKIRKYNLTANLND